MSPTSISDFGLKVWCCGLSFIFMSVIWLIPFVFVLFLLFFLFYNAKRYQNDPEFKWSDMGITFFFYILIIIEAYFFLSLWDYLGVPIKYIMKVLSGQDITQEGMTCLIPEVAVQIKCCTQLKGYDNIKDVINLMIGIIILGTKILVFLGSLAMIFLWGYSRYKHAKPSFLSGGGGNIALLYAQSVFAGFVIILFLSFIYLAYEHLLFFNVRAMITNVFQCIMRF